MDEKYIQEIYNDLSSRYGANNILAFGDFSKKISSDSTFARQTYDDFANTYGKDKILGFDDFYTKVKSQQKVDLSFVQTDPNQQLQQAVAKKPVAEKPDLSKNESDQYLNFGEPVKPTINKLAVAVNKDKKKEGSTGAGIYNTLVESFSRGVGGLVKIGEDIEDLIAPESWQAHLTDEQGKPISSRQIVTTSIDKNLRSGASTKEQEAARKEFDVTDGVSANDVEAMLFQAPSQVADLIAGAFTRGSSFFVQSVNDSAEELEKTPGAEQLSGGQKMGYVYTNASVQAVLETLAVGKVLKNTGLTKGVKDKLTKEIIDELVAKGEKATASQIEEMALRKATQFVSKAKRIGFGSATGAVTEGLTEGAQQGVSDAIKLATNKLSGKNVFDEEDIKKNFIKNTINSTVLGGTFGGVFGGLSGSVNNTNKAIREQVSQAQTPEDLEAIQQQISEQVEAGAITEEEADNANEKTQQYAEIASKIPSNIDADTKYKIIGGIEQRNDLESEIQKVQTEMEGVDPAFHKDKKDRLELLQGKLGEVNDYLEGIVEGGAPTYEEKNGKYIKISASGEETEIPKQQYEFGKAIQENENRKTEEPQQEQGDIATEQINIIEDGEGQRGEEGRQELLNQPTEEIKTEDAVVEEPVSSVEESAPVVGISKQKEQEIDIATKPDLKLNFIDDAELSNREVMGKGKNRKGQLVDKKVKYGKAEAPVRAKYEILKSLMDCLDS